jgi:hypothetical protein
MIAIDNSDNYYYFTTFPDYDIYNYFIFAYDSYGNSEISKKSFFSVPPNWDISNDGICNSYDNQLFSNRYGETGNPGWIREDVDNNGVIQVIDLVMISEHYGEQWN